jgi:DNA mismatch repair protein MutS2
MIERARSLLAPESREAADLIAYLHRSRDELDRMQQQMAAERHALEEERRKLRTEWVKRQQKRIEELEDKFTDMQKRFDENVARVVEAVKEREDLNAALVQTISESQTDLGVSSQAAASVSRDQLQPGARIRVRGFNKPVVLRRLDGSSAEIEAGPLRMKVAVDEIIAVEGAPAPKAPMARQNITVTSQSTEGRTDEINVIGSTVEEATERVDKFLDEAALANRQRVRVIHGHGTGALRKGLAQFLSSHPLVERVVSESDDRGGKAVTVVELRS